MKFDIAVKTGLASTAALMTGVQGAEAQSFEGLYSGLSATYLGGDAGFNAGDSYDYQLNEDAALGVFVGYNRTLANGMIAGVELAFTPDVASDDNPAGSQPSNPEEYQTNIIDLKFKYGRELGGGASAGNPIMLYGFGGVSGLDSRNDSDADYGTAFGVNYGLGVEMAMSSGILIGLELIGRTVDGYGYNGSSSTRSNYGASLRAGFRF